MVLLDLSYLILFQLNIFLQHYKLKLVLTYFYQHEKLILVLADC